MADNPPAFPRTGEGFGNSHYDTPGMTLRDWFAGQALAGLACNLLPKREEALNNGEADASWEASLAYRLADAMLNQREKSA